MHLRVAFSGGFVCVLRNDMYFVQCAHKSSCACVVWPHLVFKTNFVTFHSAGPGERGWCVSVCVCVFKGCVAGHGSMLEMKGVCSEKPSGSYVVNFWLGVWCVYICVCV